MPMARSMGRLAGLAAVLSAACALFAGAAGAHSLVFPEWAADLTEDALTSSGQWESVRCRLTEGGRHLRCSQRLTNDGRWAKSVYHCLSRKRVLGMLYDAHGRFLVSRVLPTPGCNPAR